MRDHSRQLHTQAPHTHLTVRTSAFAGAHPDAAESRGPAGAVGPTARPARVSLAPSAIAPLAADDRSGALGWQEPLAFSG